MSCNYHSHNEEAYNIINQNFISIIGTHAYDYNTLRPSPNMPRLVKRKSAYPLNVIDNFESIKTWENEIVNSLKKNSIKECQSYINLLKSHKNDEFETLNLKKIKNAGLYKLYPIKDVPELKDYSTVGVIQFSQIISEGNFAMMVVKIQDNIKSGVEKLVLLKKENSNWVINQEFEISVW